jgi:hypothetical protein
LPRKETGMNKRIAWAGGLIVALLAMVASGCAGLGTSATPLPPAKMLQESDMASLAGEWQGTLRGVGGRGPVQGRTANARVTVAPDGSFTTSIDGRPGVGKGRIVGGNIVFEGSTTRGTATLHEGGGRRVLVGQGTWVGFDGESAFELTPR